MTFLRLPLEKKAICWEEWQSLDKLRLLGLVIKKTLLLIALISLLGCNSDRVNKEPFVVTKTKTYPSLVMAPPACKLPENRNEGYCSSYNYLEQLTKGPTY